MTKQVRDWHKDMTSVSQFLHAMTLHNDPPFDDIEPTEVALHYWLKQYAAEKERADKAEERHKFTKDWAEATVAAVEERLELAEAREKKLREAIEKSLSIYHDDGLNDEEAVEAIRDELESILASLYTEEETK